MASEGRRKAGAAFAVLFSVLAASIVTTIVTPSAAFAVTDPSASMNQWSPFSTSGNDGTPVTVFTFSANANGSAGLLAIEWDFDGDGNVDETTPISGAPNHVSDVTVTHVFGDENVYWPKVRSVDINNNHSDWDDYEDAGNPVPMDVFWPPPVITMLQWEPFAVSVGQPVTFSATAFNEVGVLEFQWDFDGDGEPDAFSPAEPLGAQDASGSITYTYTGDLSAFPAVRALDNDIFISAWDVYDIGGEPVLLVVGEGSEDVPEAVMHQWGPYSSTDADGLPMTVFTFSATGEDESGVDRFEWDFDGDGIIDATTEANGETSISATATYTYDAVGSWTPKVRIININGVASAWSPYMIADMPVLLDVVSPSMSPALDFTPRAAGDVGYDGTTSTSFAFTATYSGNPVGFNWDFDGDGDIDLETTSPNASYTYTRRGLFLPSVTVQDKFGTRAFVSPIDAQGRPLYATVIAPGEDPALFDPVRTYCDNMTIEQLIATGRYNVMDYRTSSHTIIRGTLHDDLILGGRVHNLILGSAGDDCIITGGGSGQAYGNSGNDIIIGSESDERLVGGAGNDVCIPIDGIDVTISCESTVYEF